MSCNVIVVAQLYPFAKNKGSAARLLCLLQWLRSKDFRLTFVLQPLDVDYPQFIPELTSIVDELIVVQREDLVERVLRLTSLPARVGRRALSAFLPPKRLPSPAAPADYTD